jgi:protein-disulfide isomerase
MAKNQSQVSEPESDAITIDMQMLLVPASILLSGLMISVSLFLGLKSVGDTTLSSGKVTATVEPTTSPIDGTAKTTISTSPYLGNKDTATIAIVEFSDYECPYCKVFYQQTYKELLKTYVDSGKAIYVYRNFIAVTGHNPAATDEAIAAECVKKLSNNNTSYFDYHDYLFTNTSSNGSGITGGKEAYTAKALTYGIDKTAFNSCLADSTIAAAVKKDEEDAVAAGVRGTPGFVIGKLDKDGNVDGLLMSGAQPVSTFKQVIDQVLSN